MIGEPRLSLRHSAQGRFVLGLRQKGRIGRNDRSDQYAEDGKDHDDFDQSEPFRFSIVLVMEA